MTKTNRCPRCGREAEGDFCPNCDLYSTEHGVYRPSSNSKKCKDSEQQVIKPLDHKESVSFFEKRNLEEVTFSKDFYNRTVEEVIQENNKHRYQHLKLKTFEEQQALGYHLISIKDNEVSGDGASPLLVDEEKALRHYGEDEKDKVSVDSKDNVYKEESTHSLDIEQKVKEGNEKQQKMILSMITVIIVAIILSVSIFFINRYQQTQRKIDQQIVSIEKQIKKFYVDQDPNNGFIAKKVTKENTNAIVESIDALAVKEPDKAKELEKELSKLENNSELEQGINNLFESPKIVGKQVKNVALKEGQTIQFVAVKNPKNAFEKAINSSIKDAKQQQTDMTDAKKSVQSLISQDDVSKGISAKDYENAYDKVQKVKNKDLKSELNKQLDTVKETIDKRQAEKEEQDRLKKIEESSKKEEKAKDSEISDSSQQNEIQTNTKEQKVASSKAKADPTNGEGTKYEGSAYNWAPGIQGKVISTCIRRGYITEDGYELRPAYESNGDGYYNLYGTNNNSKLLKNYSQSQLPVYLVTINCKTGWFKGNG